MHLHGHNFYVLHEGPGLWDGTIIRPSNPHRRDVHLVRAGGHLAVQFDGAPGSCFLYAFLSPHFSHPSPFHPFLPSLPLDSLPLNSLPPFTPTYLP
jgi:hypothetical protein